jgi:ATP-binding cassette subfamily C exporter for protease/lipase
MLRDGTVAMFGPTKDVLNALQEANQKQLQAQQAQRQASAAAAPAATEQE